MPVQDWSRVDARIFHDFHTVWIGQIRSALNEGLLPPGYYALTLASYAAGERIEIYLEHVAVGAPLPEMPLFLSPDRYINVPLEPTYRDALRGVPAFWREILEENSA